MRVGIDLLWVRPGKNGGTESYIRNILDGLLQYSQGIEYFLYVSLDNQESFEKYYNAPMFVKRLCPVNTASQAKRVIWQNMHQDRYGRKDKLDVWFIPVYSKPFLTTRKVPYITTIHDVQAAHYPEYFSKFRNLFFKLCWQSACDKSAVIVTISEFCKKDIAEHLKVNPDKVKVIYNPIITNACGADFETLKQRYGIEDNNFYYTVSALAKHKNIQTLLTMMKQLKEAGDSKKLLITGVKVNAENEVAKYIEENNLQETVILTGYISDAERDALYDHCEIFLFPSVFEGFGMPPVEALQRGIPVVTTKASAIYEVTQGKAVYVDDAFDSSEWIEKIAVAKAQAWNPMDFPGYTLEHISNQYVQLFKTVARKEV